MEKDDELPGVNEPMEKYLVSERYKKSYNSLIFSDFSGQEEANYAFWRRLTPSQRLELHTIMISRLYADEITKNSELSSFELVFS